MYIDPGGWSLFVQVVLGAFLAGPFLVVVFWRRVRDFVLRRKDDDSDEEGT
jgi:hypothetical protein